jgi:hypothetical protein
MDTTKFDHALATEGRESEQPKPKRRKQRHHENQSDPLAPSYRPPVSDGVDQTTFSRYTAANNRNFGNSFALVFDRVTR